MSEANPLCLFWEGFEPAGWHDAADGSLRLRLRARANMPPRCGCCHRPTRMVHEQSRRWVRERDLIDRRLWLDVPVRRLRCGHCGIRTEHISWLAGRRAITAALARHAETLARLWPIRQVADLLGLHWHTVKALDAARLERELPTPDRSRLRRLVMDEFALHKGHRYATVVACAETRQVLWVGEGRSRAAIRPFFEWLGSACDRIEAVAMDMNTAFDLEVAAQCPNAVVVYDRFHVIAKFGREVIDRVRVDQANALRDDRHARRAVKRGRWLLLRNRHNLDTPQAVRLDELLAANAPLMQVYLLKTQLKELWFAPTVADARQRWTDWYQLAIETGLAPVIRFANTLKRYVDGIVASVHYRLNTSVLEGMNNRIKVLKRMAYGYRDSAYFFLKIRDAFPGNVR